MCGRMSLRLGEWGSASERESEKQARLMGLTIWRQALTDPRPIGNTEGMNRLGTSTYDPRRTVPLGHMGDTLDIANYALYVFSDAGKWINGSTMVIDGGQQHMRGSQLPYPESVLEPEKVAEMFKGKSKL